MKHNYDVTRHSVFPIIVFLALTAWEWVNYTSTAQSVQGMFGAGGAVFIMGVAVVMTDIFYIVQFINAMRRAVFNGTKFQDEMRGSAVGVGAGIAWLMLTAFDTLLTWFWLAVLMEARLNAGVVQAPALIRPYMQWFPAAIAIMTWAIQAALITTAAQIIAEVANSGGLPFRPLARIARKPAPAKPGNSHNRNYEPLPRPMQPARTSTPFAQRQQQPPAPPSSQVQFTIPPVPPVNTVSLGQPPAPPSSELDWTPRP